MFLKIPTEYHAAFWGNVCDNNLQTAAVKVKILLASMKNWNKMIKNINQIYVKIKLYAYIPLILIFYIIRRCRIFLFDIWGLHQSNKDGF